jgi:nucleoside-diphosphate-sugar epimerase
MRVLIAGCGYLGLALAARLSLNGHRVSGLRRSPAGIEPGEAAPFDFVTADLTRPETLTRLAEIPWDWVIQCAAPTEGTETAYRAVYRDGSLNLLRALSPRPPRGFVFVGSTSVYGQTDGSRVDESTPAHPLDFSGRILRESEDALLAAAPPDSPVWVLRAAGIYGPGRNRIERVRNGFRPSPQDAGRRMNLIHRDDLAAAIQAVLEARPRSRIFNVCDGVHPTQAEFHAWLANRLGVPGSAASAGNSAPSARRSRSFTDKCVVADRLRRETGWEPAHPDFRAGYESLLQASA